MQDLKSNVVRVSIEDAENAYLEENFKQAIDVYQKLIELHENNPFLYSKLGQVYAKLQNWQQAIKSYNKAIDLNINNPFWVYKILGDALKEDKKFDEAIASYEKAIEIDDKNSEVYDSLGQVQSLKGDFAKAIACYQKALELNISKPYWTYINLSKALKREQKIEEADAVYQQALKLEKNESQVTDGERNADDNWLKFHNKGDECFKHGKWEDAIPNYQKVIELNPNYSWSYYNLGKALHKLKRWKDAIPNYQKAIELDLADANLYRDLGIAQEKIGDIEGQIKSYQKAIELDTQQPIWVYTTLNNLLQEQAVSVEPPKENSYVGQKPIVLFTPYYKAKSVKRQNEYIYCLLKNIQCNAIEKIVLIIDDGHQPELDSPKIEIIRIPSRPSYLDWIKLTEENCKNKISILANTDIHFDESITKFNEIFLADPKAFIALSRYEKEGLNQILHKNPHWSQDVWAVSGEHDFSESFKKYLGIALGVPRCDNKIAYLFLIHGAKIYNPCHDVKTVHVHETLIRNYDKHGDTKILGGTAWVHASPSIHEPSKLQLDIWSLNSVDITNIQVDSTWQYFEPKEKEKARIALKSSPKTLIKEKYLQEIKDININEIIGFDPDLETRNVIGFDSDWQYPAITEKYAYEMANKYLLEEKSQSEVVYFGFPWATLIDQLLHHKGDKTEAEILMNRLRSFQPVLKKFKKVITVCQHIRMLKVQEIFEEVGITDIFWSHTIKNQNYLPKFVNISLHPFPLYPVQAVGHESVEKRKKKKYVYSFVGVRAPDFYLTDSRNKIIDHLSGDGRGLIIARDNWHYNKIVYDYQIRKTTVENKDLVDKSTSEQFREVTQQSVFTLCPSGSGPNSIRLWESIGLGSIPVILADTYLPPGNSKLWEEAAVFCPETLQDIKALPDLLAKIHNDYDWLQRKRHALKQLWMMYGFQYFVYDVIKLFVAYTQDEIIDNNFSNNIAKHSRQVTQKVT